jgi:ABC-type transport system involved in multi-copper enzyme maturation permease subunit
VIVISILAGLIANAMVPLPSFQGTIVVNRTQGGSFEPQQSSEYRALAQQRATIQSSISKISPTNLYSQTASAILGISQIEGVFAGSSGNIPFRILTLAQGLEASWPNIVAIAVGLVICFIASYAKFLRSEIRPGG